MFKKFLHAILILIFLLSPIASPFVDAEYVEFSSANEPLVISKNTTWKKDDDLVFDKIISITNGATLTIEKGADVIFKQDDEIAFTKKK